MSQVIKVALQKRANENFDVIYRNDIGSSIIDAEKQANLAPGTHLMPDAPSVVRKLISGVIAGVQKQYIKDGYKDKTDKHRAEFFLDEISKQFGLLSIGVKSEDSPLADLVWTVDTIENTLFAPRLDVNQVKAILTKIESVHMTGGMLVNENIEQLRGLVTISYRKMDGLLGKVRFSGQIPADVGVALRQPYQEARANNTVVEITISGKKSVGAAKSVREQPAEQTQPVKMKEKFNYERLCQEDKEEIADMVARKLIQAMTGSSFLNKPAGHRDVYRSPNHKFRA